MNGYQGLDPPADDNPQSLPSNSKYESSIALTDPEVGDKRKHLENSEKSQNKMKSDESSGIFSIANDDYNLISYPIEEFANHIQEDDQRNTFCC